jgi:thioredoxin-dependent peroxiredoxin
MLFDVNSLVRRLSLATFAVGRKQAVQLMTVSVLLMSAGAAAPAPSIAADAAAATAVKVGDAAPDFSLAADNGKTVKLSDYKGKHNVVLFFYAKDDTPVCTKESCAFKNSYSKFKTKNAEVFGISPDDTKSHEHFKTEQSLPYLLLSDSGNKVKTAWGYPADRVTFVIDKKGKIRHMYNAKSEDQKHVDEAFKGLEDMGEDETGGSF